MVGYFQLLFSQERCVFLSNKRMNRELNLLSCSIMVIRARCSVDWFPLHALIGESWSHGLSARKMKTKNEAASETSERRRRTVEWENMRVLKNWLWMKHVKDDLVSLLSVHPRTYVHRFIELDQQSTSVRVFQGTLGAFLLSKKSGLNFRQLPVLRAN